MTFQEAYEKYNDDYIKFELVENKLSNRPDLHAFMLLDKLISGNCDIVSGAEHDEFWLSITPEELSDVATEEQMVELIRCGVRYDSSSDALAFFT